MNTAKWFLLALGLGLVAQLFIINNVGAVTSDPTYTEAQAKSRVDTACAEGNPIGFGIFITNQSFNDSTGTITYDTNVVWKGCDKGDERALAITGYANTNGTALCPMVGWYGGSDTYDCVKYISSPEYSNEGGLVCSKGRNDACWASGMKDAIGIASNRPDNSTYNLRTIKGRTGVVPNWSSVSKLSGSHRFGGNGAICAYYKVASNGWGGTYSQMCQDVFIDVSWEREWAVEGKSYIKNTKTDKSPDGRLPVDLSGALVKARIGDRLNWYHELTSKGPNAMGYDISYSISRNGFSRTDWQGRTPAAQARGGVNDTFVRHYARYADTSIDPNRSDAYTLYDVESKDMGNVLCENIVWIPKQWDDKTEGGSNQACAVVPYEYALDPTVSGLKDGDTVEADRQTVNPEGYVTNGPNGLGEGPTKSVNNVRWQLTEVVFDPGKPIPQKGAGFSAASVNPCTYVTGERANSCKNLGSGTEVNGFSASTSPRKMVSATGTSGSYEVGTRICYFMSVDNRQAGYDMPSKYQWVDTEWRHSPMQCLVVAKKPKVQVQGGDLFVGRKLPGVSASGSSEITTSTSTIGSGTTYGSWGEYGIAATGKVTGMASASTIAGGIPSASSGICNNSLLTFNNTNVDGAGTEVCNSSTVGRYSFKSALPSVASRFTVSSTSPSIGSSSVNVTALANGSTGSQVFGSSVANLELTSSGNVNLGRWIVINAPNTNVTISNNIGYSSAPMISVRQIPQVVIIAKNITIKSNVTRVDAWLIATGRQSGTSVTDGTIATCDASVASLTSKTCDKQLTVNGPVMARTLKLLRTAGAGKGDAAGDPAEVFNLRPDAYLWAMSRGNGQNKITTVDTTELPPRY